MTDVDLHSVQRLNPAPPVMSGSASPSGHKTWSNGDTASFKDVLAIINPLQHIPIVGTIYRAITGDTIAAMPSIIGGAIFGGPVGLVMSLADNAIKTETGRNVGETAMAALGIGSPAADTPAPKTLTAAAPSAQPAPNPPPKLVIDIPAPRRGETSPLPFADGKPPLVIDLPQPQWAKDAAAGRSAPAAKGGMPLTFQGPAPVAAQTPVNAQGPVAAGKASTATSSPLANARFRSTDLPQPMAEGGLARSGADLVPAPNGTPITRDAVPSAMVSALDKYGAMMRARTAQQTPTQVSVLR
jgi:hypothetical protein